MNTKLFGLALIALSAPAFAQRGHGGFHGGGGHFGGGSHVGGGFSHGGFSHGNFPHGGGFSHGGGFQRGGFSHGGGGFSNGAGFRRGGFEGTHLPTHRVYRPGVTHLSTHRVYRSARPIRINNRVNVYNRNVVRPHIAVRPYRATEWRHYDPHWNGRYYYHGGHYFYDTAYTYPAVVDNEWGTIAALSGGAAILGVLNNDPYLTFGGALGALYSYSRYESDRHSSDRHLRARAAYFSRPYFWRGGRRYDRVTVVSGGHRYYRFRRH